MPATGESFSQSLIAKDWLQIKAILFPTVRDSSATSVSFELSNVHLCEGNSVLVSIYPVDQFCLKSIHCLLPEKCQVKKSCSAIKEIT